MQVYFFFLYIQLFVLNFDLALVEFIFRNSVTIAGHVLIGSMRKEPVTKGGLRDHEPKVFLI